MARTFLWRRFRCIRKPASEVAGKEAREPLERTMGKVSMATSTTYIGLRWYNLTRKFWPQWYEKGFAIPTPR